MADRTLQTTAPGGKPAGRRPFDLKRQTGFSEIAWFCLFVLYAPIAVLIVFSFNDNRSVTLWTEFSLRWYRSALNNQGIQNAAMISLQVGAVATLVSTFFATLAALATTRNERFRGEGLVYAVINQPLMIPEIVTAVATLALFALIKQLTGVGGIGYLMLAHTVFCIPFAYMPIRARLEDMNLTLEQAAADLYATPLQVFRRITLPLMMPGIVAGAMLAFVVSFDDVIITLMVAGPGETTLPIYIFGQMRRGITPETNAVSTLIVLLSVVLVALLFFFGKRRR
ncbi:spermidine/putrescine transport system permease protein [Tistlia consotensis]|uniref:Spermidine/putrescine transport system permease protein PotC n=1 Tax=Tistlia consotensis USBA 355 TaxID=560819 RepID=A0A1Y6CP32_9PROT|nr:ABC transporter permease [Tistlia consotensis]SMF65261.1 spermidine/putrescine transport system permease protein [Tistlia consotensis USBA 355]SNS03904.1 spermidine/putrescine transport system permease protein [Tistlia consotensis]